MKKKKKKIIIIKTSHFLSFRRNEKVKKNFLINEDNVMGRDTLRANLSR